MPEPPDPFRSPGRRRQGELFTAGLLGRSAAVPVGAAALERAALGALGADAGAYFAGSAGLERTASSNSAAFDRYRLVPRVMRGEPIRDLSVELFGHNLPLPLMLAPVGVLELARRDADLHAARAAASLEIPFVVSNQSSRTLEDIAAVAGPRWFQLYPTASDALTASLIGRAERAGYAALVVTLDTTLLGWRPRDLDRGYLPFLRGRGIANYTSDPVFRELPDDEASVPKLPRPGRGIVRSAPDLLRAKAAAGAVRKFLSIYARPALRWTDLAAIRRTTRLPLLVKGILHPDDAVRAVAEGADGVIVSNHGGRQVDGAVAALDALPAVADAAGGRVPVLFDSGVRTGADVVKALALGARAVLIGRPYVWGVALAGERGVHEVLANFAAELDLTLGLVGGGAVRGLDRSVLTSVSPSVED